MLKKFTGIILGLVFSVSLVFGSGFSIYEQSAKATAMSGAFIAQANDVSALFFNPAGLTSLASNQVALGTTIIMPSASFLGPENLDANLYTPAKDLVFPPSHLYAAYKLDDRLTLGLGFYTMFGLGSEWPADWAGRELATNSHVQTYTLNPVLAGKVSDNLSVSFGLSYVYGTVTLEKSIYAGYELDTYVESKLVASGYGLGFNVGVQYKPFDRVTMGFVYRTNTELKFNDGKATFTLPDLQNEAANQLLGVYFPNTTGRSALTLPDLTGFGFAFDLTDNFTFEADYVKLGWSSYDKLVVNFEDPVAGSSQTVSEKNYIDTYSLRAGVEYRYNKQLALRAGVMRDYHAVPDKYLEPTLPEGDRTLASLGVGYKIDNYTIDAFAMFLNQDERTISNSELEVNGQSYPFNGTYNAVANLFGLTVGYSF